MPTTSDVGDRRVEGSTTEPPSASEPGLRLNTTRLARNVLLVCLGSELAFVLADYFVNYGRLTDIGALRRLFDSLDFFPSYTWAAETNAAGLADWAEARFDVSAFAALNHFSRSIEETLETAANSILWFLFLRHLGAVRAELHVQFQE